MIEREDELWDLDFSTQSARADSDQILVGRGRRREEKKKSEGFVKPGLISVMIYCRRNTDW